MTYREDPWGNATNSRVDSRGATGTTKAPEEGFTTYKLEQQSMR